MPPTLNFAIGHSLHPHPTLELNTDSMIVDMYFYFVANIVFLVCSLWEEREERVAAGSLFREKRSCSQDRRSSLRRIFL